MAKTCTQFSVDVSNVLPSGKAGAALAPGDLVYMDSSGVWQLATQKAQGIIVADVLQYQQVSPVKTAIIEGFTSQTIGSKAYLTSTGTTGNTVSGTPPAGVSQVVGMFVSATALWVDVSAANDGVISIYGSNGTYKASYSTINLACAALVSGDIVKIGAGEFTLTAAIDMTVTDVVFQGAGKNVTSLVIASGADYMFKTVFGAISSTKGITFNDINLNHGDDSTSQGIRIENTSATGRINLYINNCSFETGDGDSVHVDHAAAGAAIRMYANDTEFEGPVNFTVKNTDDRVRLERCYLAGGLVTTADDIAMEIALLWCKVLHAGVTGGHASQLLYALYCFSATGGNPEVYAALDTSDLAGSHTEQVLFPAS